MDEQAGLCLCNLHATKFFFKFHDFSMHGTFFLIFQVFHDFQSLWEPVKSGFPQNSPNILPGKTNYTLLNSFLASGELCHFLITFTNKLDLQVGSEPFGTLIMFLKDFLEKVNFKKKSADNNESMKFTQHAKIGCIILTVFFQIISELLSMPDKSSKDSLNCSIHLLTTHL